MSASTSRYARRGSFEGACDLSARDFVVTRIWSESASAGAYTLTDSTPSASAARATRMAISPRLAINTRLNKGRLSDGIMKVSWTAQETITFRGRILARLATGRGIYVHEPAWVVTGAGPLHRGAPGDRFRAGTDLRRRHPSVPGLPRYAADESGNGSVPVPAARGRAPVSSC